MADARMTFKKIEAYNFTLHAFTLLTFECDFHFNPKIFANLKFIITKR